VARLYHENNLTTNTTKYFSKIPFLVKGIVTILLLYVCVYVAINVELQQVNISYHILGSNHILNKNWEQGAIPPLNVFLIAANSFCMLLHHANTSHAVSRLMALCYVPLGIFCDVLGHYWVSMWNKNWFWFKFFVIFLGSCLPWLLNNHFPIVSQNDGFYRHLKANGHNKHREGK